MCTGYDQGKNNVLIIKPNSSHIILHGIRASKRLTSNVFLKFFCPHPTPFCSLNAFMSPPQNSTMIISSFGKLNLFHISKVKTYSAILMVVIQNQLNSSLSPTLNPLLFLNISTQPTLIGFVKTISFSAPS